MKINVELVVRFSEKWLIKGDCWEWQAATMGHGYGFIKIPGTRKQIGAHRLSYLIHYGEIPDDTMVCHTCDNPLCVKPTHLFLGVGADNLQDMKNKGRHLYGTRNKGSKLTDEKVRSIHIMAGQGVSQSEIGKSFGVGQSTIWKILHGQRWEYIYNEVNQNA